MRTAWALENYSISFAHTPVYALFAHFRGIIEVKSDQLVHTLKPVFAQRNARFQTVLGFVPLVPRRGTGSYDCSGQHQPRPRPRTIRIERSIFVPASPGSASLAVRVEGYAVVRSRPPPRIHLTFEVN